MEKIDIEINSVDGLSIELMPGHTDRRSAVVVTNGIQFSRYCSDVSKWEIHRRENDGWYRLISNVESKQESKALVFKHIPSEKINCVWDTTLGQLPQGHYRVVLTLYEGLVLGKTEPVYLAAEFDIGAEHFSEALYERDEAPAVTINCGGESLEPYFHFNYSFDFEFFADGPSVESGIMEHGAEIPEITYRDDIELVLNKNTEFKYILVYTEDCEPMDSLDSFSGLSELPSGTYYVGIVTTS
ncbi:MAG: hypothetical protein IKV79_07750, partial [Oscillospiraceae bacterium]|nr:hypothetical protein [Oscillospiraceae bacterium]